MSNPVNATEGGQDVGDRPTGVESMPASTIDKEAIRVRIAAIYQTHGDELRRFILGVTRDPEVASEVLQSTLVKALERGQEARAETLKGWLFRVAFHEAMAVRRREKTGIAAVKHLAELGRAAEALPEAPAIRDETTVAVRIALEDLPAAQRKVVMARMYDDKPFAEIAREANVPIGTVLTRMRLALDKLRRVLHGHDDD